MLSMDTHMLNNHSPDLSAQCDGCDKRFVYEDNFMIHISSCQQPIKETIISVFKCVKCDKTFVMQSDLEDHPNTEECTLPLNTCS